LRLVEALTAYDVALRLHEKLGMTCDASGPKSSRDELARRLRNLISDDGQAPPGEATAHGGDDSDLVAPLPGVDPSAKPPDPGSPPSVDPPQAPDERIPGMADLPAELRAQLPDLTRTMVSLWSGRRNPVEGLEEHRSEVLRLDLELKRMKKEDRDRTAVCFVEGVTHFLLARGVFEEFISKRRAATTKPELKRVIAAYEPLYRKELTTAQVALKKARKGAPGSFAAALFEDLSRSWSTEETTAGRGKADIDKDLVAMRPATPFELELENYCIEGGLPKGK
jgi:hypothetical protein